MVRGSKFNYFVIAEELGNAVQDAFVIAVEQQARERLERLSALKRITPVDMANLSQKVRWWKDDSEGKNNFTSTICTCF